MKGNRPVLTLNMDEKIYLAVAKRDVDKLSFVYTLACLKTGKVGNSYNLIPTRQIHTFTNKEAAQIYHDTIEEIVDANSNDETKQTFFSANEKLLDIFMENTR